MVREHTEKIKPPRALWVPFELGRPFGRPGQPEFQLDVLRALLGLFERGRGPVLEDYPEDSALPNDIDIAWACTLPLPPLEPAATTGDSLTQAVLQEVGNLGPWFSESVRRRNRTTFGLSGLTPGAMPQIAEFLARKAAGEDPAPPEGLADPMPAAIRFMVDDVKAYYMEAANEQPGAPPPGGVRMWQWFFHETRMGGILYDLRDRFNAEREETTKTNGGQPPASPPPPNLISARFARRPTSAEAP